MKKKSKNYQSISNKEMIHIIEYIEWSMHQMYRAAKTLQLCEEGIEAVLPKNNFYTMGLNMCADEADKLLRKYKTKYKKLKFQK